VILVPGSITPRPNPPPEIRPQPPSMLSLRSSASTVAPEHEAPLSAPSADKRGARRRLWFFAALATVVGVVSAAALGGFDQVSGHVHSGSPGYRLSKTGKAQHWQKQALTIYLDDSINKLGASDAVMQAFGHWVESDPRLPDITFDSGRTSAEPKRDGKSTVSYARITAPGHEHDLAITMTYSEEKSGEIVEADIVLNSLYPIGVLRANPQNWHRDGERDSTRSDGNSKSLMAAESEDCQNRYDVQNVTTHEAGHFFGLGEDPVERGATMFQTIDQCETHKRALSATDVSALAPLYTGSADSEDSGTPRACSFGTAPARENGAAWLSALVVGLLIGRRRR
jgi:hypothetical protein